MTEKRAKAAALLEEYPYAYATVYDGSDGSILFQGTVRGLFRLADVAALRISSLFVMETEDGGAEAELTVNGPAGTERRRAACRRGS